MSKDGHLMYIIQYEDLGHYFYNVIINGINVFDDYEKNKPQDKKKIGFCILYFKNLLKGLKESGNEFDFIFDILSRLGYQNYFITESKKDYKISKDVTELIKYFEYIKENVPLGQEEVLQGKQIISKIKSLFE